MSISASNMTAKGAEPWLLTSSSDDVNGHCANLGRWRLDYDQISRGRFIGSFTEVRLPNVQVFRETTSQKVRQYGRLGSDSFGIGLPWNARGEINFNGSCMSVGNAIACFDAEVDLCTPLEFELRGIVMEASLVEKTLSSMKMELNKGVWNQLRELRMEPGPTERIRQLLHFVEDVTNTAPLILSDPDARKHLEDNILSAIFDMLPTVRDCEQVRSASERKRVVDRACSLIFSRPDQPMSMLDVCKGVGASRRKLSYCFLEVLGTNPVNYLRAVRLNKVRRELRCCTDERIGVYDVAVKWGFWHFSQFSLDYKRQFAELPSDTLRRARVTLH